MSHSEEVSVFLILLIHFERRLQLSCAFSVLICSFYVTIKCCCKHLEIVAKNAPSGPYFFVSGGISSFYHVGQKLIIVALVLVIFLSVLLQHSLMILLSFWMHDSIFLRWWRRHASLNAFLMLLLTLLSFILLCSIWMEVKWISLTLHK